MQHKSWLPTGRIWLYVLPLQLTTLAAVISSCVKPICISLPFLVTEATDNFSNNNNNQSIIEERLTDLYQEISVFYPLPPILLKI